MAQTTTQTIFGQKIGMTHIFSEAGKMLPVSVIACEPLTVIRKKTKETDGYEALVVAWGKTLPWRKNRPDAGQTQRFGAYKYLREIPIQDGVEVGATIDSSIFADVPKVDVQGVSKGKGFAGTVKRHGFGRGPETHGHDHHRAPGSVGAGTTPGRVFKNTKMAGRMGNKTVSSIGNTLISIDTERNLLLIQGGIPGPKGTVLRITASTRK